eukprot:gene20135-39765_t
MGGSGPRAAGHGGRRIIQQKGRDKVTTRVLALEGSTINKTVKPIP